MSVKDDVLKRLLNSNEFISGQELAETLNVSRNAVWKAVKSLESDGYKINAVNNRGYKLVMKHNILSSDVIQNKLETKVYGRNLIILDEVNSTNNYAKTLALNGAVDGTVVISDCQTAGRGRMGRSFFSPKGTGLYISMVIRPDININSAQLITPCIAVATAEAIEKLSGADVKIKWVNDLFLGGRKISGILTEASFSFEEKKLDYAIIGIGINISTAKNLPDELKPIVTSIEDETNVNIDRNALCSELLNSFENHMLQLEQREFLNEYRRRSFIFGKRVSVINNNREKIGIALDIDENASLIVQFENGEKATINSGEARIIKADLI